LVLNASVVLYFNFAALAFVLQFEERSGGLGPHFVMLAARRLLRPRLNPSRCFKSTIAGKIPTRAQIMEGLMEEQEYDVLVIGGGATGAGK
jgi:hypothetical protein